MRKIRNQLLALGCILAFVAMGYLYVRTWVVQKPFGIILFMSDGMVSRHLTAARLYAGGADHHLALEAFPHLALVRNPGRDFAVPDAAAAATALATGVRVNHRAIAADARGQSLPSLLETARAGGRTIGLVTNGPLAAPASAAFYAHALDGRDSVELARQFVDRGPLDVALAGGAADFLPESSAGRRKDGRDLVAELRALGCEMVGNKAELENAPAYRTGPIVGLFSFGSLPFANQVESGSSQPTLADMVRRAIVFLQQNRTGYVLVVDATLVTTAAERNEGERTLAETLALDQAVATALRYAGENSLVVAVGKHGTGGLSLNGYPLRQDRGVALLGSNPAGYPYITWGTGPNGSPATEPAAFQTPSGLNTAEDVIAVGRGKGAERLRGFIDNTVIYEMLRGAL